MAKQTEIAYEPTKEWQDFQTGGTRIDAADLNNMEQGISDACAAVDELRTKRLPTYLVATGGDTATQDVYQGAILGPCLIVDLATATTYYDNGEDGEGHERTKLTSGADIDDLRDSLSQTSSAALTFSPYQTNVATHDFRAVRLPGGAARAKLIWTLKQAIPAGSWHAVGTLSGEDLALVARSVEAAGNDAAYFACSASTSMCTLSVSPAGVVRANAVSALSAGHAGIAVFDLTPLPS